MASNYTHTQSVWQASTGETAGYPSLSGDLSVDVAIIGGGITGISTAYNLVKKGRKVIVLESGKIGMGTTGTSTGNLYIPTGQFHTILSKHGAETLNDVASSRAAGMSFIEDRIREYNIDCDYRRVPWNYFSLKKPGSKEIQKEFDAIKECGMKVIDVPASGFPFGMHSIARVDLQAQFNPLQYVKQLAAAIANENDCRIFENTRVTGIKEYDPCYIETTGGTVKAGKVVQATHTPKGIYMVHAQMEVYREYAIAAKIGNNVPPEGIYWALVGKEKYSIRTYSTGSEKYLIVLGDTRKTGHKKLTEESFIKIESFLRDHFDVQDISYLWAAQNYSPADYLPYIGNSPLEANVYIATGFSADGLVYGTTASMIISDLITGVENRWAKTFDPKRFNPGKAAIKTIRENVDVTAHLVKDYIFKGNEEELAGIKPDEGRIVQLRNDKAAAHMDPGGTLHLVSAKCTHMGCIVHWNSAEKSWDCPCHGSRFSITGEVLEGPAFDGLYNYKISGGDKTI